MSEEQCGCAFKGEHFQVTEMDCPIHGVNGHKTGNEDLAVSGYAIYGIAGGVASTHEFQVAWVNSMRFHAEAIQPLLPELAELLFRVVGDVEQFMSGQINLINDMISEIYESLNDTEAKEDQ